MTPGAGANTSGGGHD